MDVAAGKKLKKTIMSERVIPSVDVTEGSSGCLNRRQHLPRKAALHSGYCSCDQLICRDWRRMGSPHKSPAFPQKPPEIRANTDQSSDQPKPTGASVVGESMRTGYYLRARKRKRVSTTLKNAVKRIKLGLSGAGGDGASASSRKKDVSLMIQARSATCLDQRLVAAVRRGNYSRVEECLKKGSETSLQARREAFDAAVESKQISTAILLSAHMDPESLALALKGPKRSRSLDRRLAPDKADPLLKTLFAVLEEKAVEEKTSQAEFAVEDSDTLFANASAAYAHARAGDGDVGEECGRGEEVVNLLALDGGGVRGLVICEILSMIEKRRKMLYPDQCPFLSNFQWIAGTSTGSIMVLGHVYKGFTPEMGRAMYWNLKDHVFQRGQRKDGLSKVLQEVLGEECLQHKTCPKVVIPTTLANQNPPALHLMCNYGNERDGQAGPGERRVWEAARASSAAPFHFTAFNDYFLDGGLLANNPTLDAMTEITNYKEEGEKEEGSRKEQRRRIGCVVSLGTGKYSKPNRKCMSVDTKSVFQLALRPKTAKRVLSKGIISAAVTPDIDVRRARAWCSGLGAAYFRFNPELKVEVDLSETDAWRLLQMEAAAQEYVRCNTARVDKLLDTIYRPLP